MTSNGYGSTSCSSILYSVQDRRVIRFNHPFNCRTIEYPYDSYTAKPRPNGIIGASEKFVMKQVFYKHFLFSCVTLIETRGAKWKGENRNVTTKSWKLMCNLNELNIKTIHRNICKECCISLRFNSHHKIICLFAIFLSVPFAFLVISDFFRGFPRLAIFHVENVILNTFECAFHFSPVHYVVYSNCGTNWLLLEEELDFSEHHYSYEETFPIYSLKPRQNSLRWIYSVKCVQN